MKRFQMNCPGFVLALGALLLLGSVALAQDDSGYDLSWWTVDGGGGTVSNGGSGYTLMGTAGQPDASTLTGSSYTLVGGFWGGGAAAAKEYEIYLPVILRNF